MRRTLLQRFLVSAGPALCAVSDAAEAMHSAPTEAKEARAWGDLWEAAFDLHRALTPWREEGIRLADLPAERFLPEHRRLWCAAEALAALPPAVSNERLAVAVTALLSAAHRAGAESYALGIRPAVARPVLAPGC